MALRKLTLPIIFAFLLFSQVFARDLLEKPDNKEANVAGAGDAEFPYVPGPYYRQGPYYGHRPPYCRYYCGPRCCSAEEFAAFSQAAAADEVGADGFSDEKQYGRYPYGPRFPPWRPPYCRFYCRGRCCSAEEYAEFVQAGN